MMTDRFTESLAGGINVVHKPLANSHNGFVKPEFFRNGHDMKGLTNGRELNPQNEMDMDTVMSTTENCIFSSNVNHISNGANHFNLGRKRFSDAMMHAEDVKRFKVSKEADVPLVEKGTIREIGSSGSQECHVLPCLPQHQSTYGMSDINRHVPRCTMGCYI